MRSGPLARAGPVKRIPQRLGCTARRTMAFRYCMCWRRCPHGLSRQLAALVSAGRLRQGTAELEPRHRPAAAPLVPQRSASAPASRPPPRRPRPAPAPGHRTRCARPPRPAPAAGGRNGHRNRPARSRRPAVPHAAGHQLTAQQDSHVQARMPGAEHPAGNARATPTCPASAWIVTLSRTLMPPTMPPPSRPPGRKGTPGAGGHRARARPAHPRASSRNQPPPRPVRGRPWNADGAHRPPQLRTPTVVTAHTDRLDGTDARPPCVRGPRNTGVHSGTR
jgi:hypothetical protein